MSVPYGRLSALTLHAGKSLDHALNPDRKRGEPPEVGIIVIAYNHPPEAEAGTLVSTDIAIDITGDPLFAANVLNSVIMRLGQRYGGSDK